MKILWSLPGLLSQTLWSRAPESAFLTSCLAAFLLEGGRTEKNEGKMLATDLLMTYDCVREDAARRVCGPGGRKTGAVSAGNATACPSSPEFQVPP